MSAFWSVKDLDVTFTPGTKHVNITSPKILTCDVPHNRRCDRICVMTTGCRSYFYSSNTGVCQFHSGVFNSTDGVALHHGLHYYYNDVDYTHLSNGKTHLYIKHHMEKKTWYEALQVCVAEGGTLVKLDTSEKNNLLLEKFDFQEFAWIGLSDTHDNDTWFWTDGSPLDRYINWGFNEPNNENDGVAENCATMKKFIFVGAKWVDTFCESNREFLCEFKKFNT